MPRPLLSDDDLFRESTMTFGEHLEELRACLFKSVIGLFIGVLLGLSVGRYVVLFIQTPMTSALEEYFQHQAAERLASRAEEMHGNGKGLPPDSPKVEAIMAREHLLADEVWISPAEVLQQLQQAYPQQFKDVKMPMPPPGKELSRENMIHTFLFRSVDDDARVRTKSLNAQEPFSIYIKAAFLVGALISSPWIFYQIWTFVAAGLYPHERRYVRIFLPFSLGLFLSGAALAFFCVFKPVLTFLFGFNAWLGIDPDPRINEWLGFVLLLPLAFGVSFQLPLVMLFMERIGIFDVRAYLSSWRMSVLIIFIIALILTPSGDPYSMCLMALPLTGLYFGGILLCKWLPRSKSRFEEIEAQEV